MWRLLFLCVLCMLLVKCTFADGRNDLRIAGLFHNDNLQAMIPFNSLTYASNVMNQRVRFRPVVLKNISRTDTMEMQLVACTLVEQIGIGAIFGPDSRFTKPMVEAITTKLEIPHFQTTCFDTRQHANTTILNFCPETNLFAKALSVVVDNLRWRDFIVFYEDDNALVHLQGILKLQDYNPYSERNRIYTRKLTPNQDYRPIFKDVKNGSVSQYVIDCHVDRIIPILDQAHDVGMMGSLKSFFLTSLDAHTLDYTKYGKELNITTIRMTDTENEAFKTAVKNWKLTELHAKRPTDFDTHTIRLETALMYDAMRLFIESVDSLDVTGKITPRPLSCDSDDIWEDGLRIVTFMKEKQPKISLTGPIKFNNNGQRIDFTLQLVEVNHQKVIATWTAKTPDVLYYNRSREEYEKTIEENLQATVVKVYSRIGEPYLRRKPDPDGEALEGNNRFEGFSMDFIKEIANFLNIKFEFHINQGYGTFNNETKEWNGLIREILDKNAHLAICDLTITHQRQSAVDFSQPFMTLGLSILYKIPEKEEENKMFAFMKPFGLDIWMYTATLYLVITIVLYFIARLNAGDWENPNPLDEDPEELESMWDMKNGLWMTLGSILMQAGDVAPKGISSRTVVTVWWFFALLIANSSYTANLASFLSKSRDEPNIDNVDELADQTKIKYGCLFGGATYSFFAESKNPLYQKMFANMVSTKPSPFRKTNDDGVKMVRSSKEGLFAFLMESTQIEYETETKCDLVQVGGWLDTKRYGIAMPMNAPYRHLINKAILALQENGTIDELKKKWWKQMRNEPSCKKDAAEEDDSDAMGLDATGGVYLVVHIGIVLAFLFGAAEFLWHVRTLAVEQHLPYWQALKWEAKFAFSFGKGKKPTAIPTDDGSKSGSGSKSKSSKHESASRRSSRTTRSPESPRTPASLRSPSAASSTPGD